MFPFIFMLFSLGLFVYDWYYWNKRFKKYADDLRRLEQWAFDRIEKLAVQNDKLVDENRTLKKRIEQLTSQ